MAQNKFGIVVFYAYLCINKKDKNMGYTHYWGFKGGASASSVKDGAKKFERASAIIGECLKKVQEMGITIRNGVGRGEPEIKKNLVYFNGDASKGEDHETFYIDLDERGADFCKTCHKPYNLLVILSLLAFKHEFGDDFEYSSDGITKEDYESRESNEYWKSIGYNPEGPSADWVQAYEVWDGIKRKLGLVG